MKIVIAGGSGQVGTILARAFHASGDEVVVLSRRSGIGAPWRVAAWDGISAGGWQQELDGSDVVINLAGRSVNCRYTAAHRKEILDSRVLPTRLIGAAVEQAARPPRLWLQASTATIYAHRFDRPNDEHSGVLGGAEPGVPGTWKFSIDVARAWEAAFDQSVTRRTRKVALRSAMTMSPDAGGIFDTLLKLVRRGLGGAAGCGRPIVSGVHEDDFVSAVRWLIERDDVAGVVNIAAPHPLPYAEFMRVLREASGTRFGLPANRWMLELGAFFMRTETELVLKSRRVVPARLLEGGFAFKYPQWPAAARDLVKRWRQLDGSSRSSLENAGEQVPDARSS
jgi:uncharacterized protein (TIGR01777 family)